MSKLLLLFTLVTICMAVFGNESKIKCYSCDSDNDPSCNDPEKKHEKDCGTMISSDDNTSYCFKKVTRDISSGKQKIVRTCKILTNRDTTETCKQNDPNIELVYCDGCKENLCNSSHRSRITILGIFLSVLLCFSNFNF